MIVKLLKNIKIFNFNKKLTVEKYFDLSEEKRMEICQKLNPYNKSEWEIFKSVEKKFITEYGQNQAIENVFCGFAKMTGPYNAISITIKKGEKKTNLPKLYYGFPVLKEYNSGKKN